MLKELYIKNVAVIDEAVINFEKGFNVLTGETGAGKSILIDAINMVIGSRSNRELVRTGTEKAITSATFEVKNQEVLDKLSELGIEPEGGDIILLRQISADGKSTCRCNGIMLPLGSLREIGELLVDIHGQHDNQKIMNKASHIDFLDGYGKYGGLIAEYKEIYAKYKAVLRELEEINSDKEERARKLDLLAFQINEIEAAHLKENEDNELEERRNFLANAEKIVSGAGSAYEALYGGEYQMSAFDLLMKASGELEYITEYDEKLKNHYERLNSAMADIEDITAELKAFLDKTDYSQSELDSIEERLSTINTLKRKYGSTIEDINVYLSKIREEYNRYNSFEESTELLLARKENIEKEIKETADRLSSKRRQTGKELEEKITTELADLDMPNVRFSVSFEESEYNQKGQESVEFLISANLGEEIKPMNKIASGGELSRIMLAIKSVMAETDSSETMIFDEIDTGVSGRAAQKIAEKIAGFAGSCQVFAVTHLSQIAAMADTHFLIRKESRNDKTYTQVSPLDNEGRIKELGRIIGGVTVTETTLKSAEEMLEMAEDIKRSKKYD